MNKQDWERIAVLGTEKKRFSEPQREQLTAWGIISSSSEQGLLQALAIVHKQHEAGFKPQVTDYKISPAPPETRASMNMKSTGVLNKLVGTGNLYLIAELLQLAIHYNQRLSEYLLTDLMVLGTEKKMLFLLFSSYSENGGSGWPGSIRNGRFTRLPGRRKPTGNWPQRKSVSN